MVIQPHDSGRLSCVRNLVCILMPGKSDGESFHRVTSVLLRDAGDEGGIDTAAEENSYLYVRHELTLDRLLQKETILLNGLGATLYRHFVRWRREGVLAEGQLGAA